MKFRDYFKKISDTVQFVAALVTLLGFILAGPSVTKLVGRIVSARDTVPFEPKPLDALLGIFEAVVTFIILYCVLFVLWNLVLCSIGKITHFIRWRATYKIFSGIVALMLILWMCEFAYRIFFGDPWVLSGGQLKYYIVHAPWCIYYAFISIVLAIATLYRVYLEIEEEEQKKKRKNYPVFERKY